MELTQPRTEPQIQNSSSQGQIEDHESESLTQNDQQSEGYRDIKHQSQEQTQSQSESLTQNQSQHGSQNEFETQSQMIQTQTQNLNQDKNEDELQTQAQGENEDQNHTQNQNEDSHFQIANTNSGENKRNGKKNENNKEIQQENERVKESLGEISQEKQNDEWKSTRTDISQPLLPGWTNTEHSLFLEGLQKFSVDWKKIGEFMSDSKPQHEVIQYGKILYSIYKTQKVQPLSKKTSPSPTSQQNVSNSINSNISTSTSTSTSTSSPPSSTTTTTTITPLNLNPQTQVVNSPSTNPNPPSATEKPTKKRGRPKKVDSQSETSQKPRKKGKTIDSNPQTNSETDSTPISRNNSTSLLNEETTLSKQLTFDSENLNDWYVALNQLVNGNSTLSDHLSKMLEEAAKQVSSNSNGPNYARIYQFFASSFQNQRMEELSEDEWKIIDSLIEELEKSVLDIGCQKQTQFIEMSLHRLKNPKDGNPYFSSPNPLAVPVNLLNPLRQTKK